VPMVFLHQRIDDIRAAFHLPEWVWPLVVAPVVLMVLHRVHEVAVELVDHAFNRAYHRARRGLEEAGRAVLAAGDMAAIDRDLTEAPARWLRLASAAVFRDAGGVLRRAGPAVGWEAALAELHPELDAPVLACLATGRPTRLPHLQWRRELFRADDAAPCLAVPVLGWAGQVRAVSLYGPHASGSDITGDECEMLHALAVQAGRGYDRVEMDMMRRELGELRARLGAPADARPSPAG